MTDLDRLARQIAEEVLAELSRTNGASPDSCCGGGGGPGSKCQTQGCPSSGGCRQCAAHVPEKVAEIVACGANRIEGGLGVGRVRPDLAGYIDHTLLKPEATYSEIQTLCREAALYGFCSVCINPCWVTHCAELLKGSAVKVCTVIGFPLGATTTDIKVLEARQAQENGATELDMVINVGALKTGDRKYVEQDIRAVVEEARPGVLVKVILETGLLSDEEKVTACELARAAGADFVKTSTGFGPGGATASDIALMRSIVGPEMGVKASGGVKDCQRADLMVRAGATRIGASAGVGIVSQCKAGGPAKAAAGY